jgi:hypothetical protein
MSLFHFQIVEPGRLASVFMLRYMNWRSFGFEGVAVLGRTRSRFRVEFRNQVLQRGPELLFLGGVGTACGGQLEQHHWTIGSAQLESLSSEAKPPPGLLVYRN